MRYSLAYLTDSLPPPLRRGAWCLLLLWAIWGAGPAQARQADSLLLTSAASDYLVWPHAELLADSTGKLFPEEAMRQGGWIPAAQSQAPDPRKVHWLRFSVHNAEGSSFEQYRLSVAFTDRVSLYVLSPDGYYSEQESGDLMVLPKRPVPHGQMVFMRMAIPYGSTRTCLLRFESETDISRQFRAEALKSVHLYTEEGFAQRFEQPRFYQAFFYGAMFIMAFYNLFIFISLRSKEYLHYVLYLLMLCLFFSTNAGYIAELVLPDHPRIDLYLRFLSTPAVMLAYIGFSQGFLNSRREAPRLHTTLMGMAGIFALSALAMGLGYWKMGRTLAIVAALATYVLIVVMAVRELRKGYTPARYFLGANLLLILGATIFALSRLAGMVQNPLTQYGVQLGVVLEVALLSIGLADRINVSKREAEAQKQAQAQLRREQELERQRLIESKNRELEEKVVLRTQEVVAQKEAIERINQGITDSIQYAKRIQQALMGDAGRVGALFSEGFVLLCPRDIVSGDFFWFGEIGGKRIAIAADCTGHGVPGAFMTVMGHSLLGEIVLGEGIWRPDEILTELDRKVRANLHAGGGGANDGMDMAVLSIDPEARTAYFAGAKNPLCYVRDGEIVRVKGSANAIGGRVMGARDYACHEIALEAGDWLYLFSDGFQDQFGGPDGRKYMSTRFRDLLLRNSGMAGQAQADALREELEQWKKGGKQTDDVLVIGLRP